jgi:hypothetical protein
MMPVFAILVHTQPSLVARLVERLHPYPIVMHVDVRTDASAFAALPRTTYVRHRVPVRWGGFSMIRATSLLYEHALQVANPDEHIVLLSGQCYPARPIAEFARFLSDSPFRQHCKAGLVFDGTREQRRLTRRWYWDHLPAGPGSTYLVRAAARRAVAFMAPRRSEAVFEPLRPVAGSQWTALTADCVRDLLVRSRDSHLIGLFKNTLAPDESFFHTLLYNSRWRHQVPDPVLAPRGVRTTSDFANFHYIRPTLKGIVTLSDLEAIKRSEMFFVRKVSANQSDDLLDALDGMNIEGNAHPSTPRSPKTGRHSNH